MTRSNAERAVLPRPYNLEIPVPGRVLTPRFPTLNDACQIARVYSAHFQIDVVVFNGGLRARRFINGARVRELT